ncbi:unnamed protein product [Sphenostylis stenocarpa]|uniref:Uncharacterized protein n=1 Tax=Sphenostylis stenocarpa TaxID=92480 RepID=A0AA87BCZ6_9FABA|nr:unnamed protein product [Sphenostylis stenocarpa]
MAIRSDAPTYNQYVLGPQHVQSAWSMLSPGVASWHLAPLTCQPNLIHFLIKLS